jgi:hypothetical protein
MAREIKASEDPAAFEQAFRDVAGHRDKSVKKDGA